MSLVELEALAKGCEGILREQALLEMKPCAELIGNIDSVPCTDSLPLCSPLWAGILTLILQVDKGPRHVQYPLATHPNGPRCPPPPLLSGEIQAQKSPLCKFAQLTSYPIGQIQWDACYIPLFWASFNQSRRGSVSGCWAEKRSSFRQMECPGSPGRGPEGLRLEAGLEPRANATPSSWCLAQSWLSCIWVRWRKLGLWAAGKLFKIPSWRKSSVPILKPPQGSVLP